MLWVREPQGLLVPGPPRPSHGGAMIESFLFNTAARVAEEETCLVEHPPSEEDGVVQTTHCPSKVEDYCLGDLVEDFEERSAQTDGSPFTVPTDLVIPNVAHCLGMPSAEDVVLTSALDGVLVPDDPDALLDDRVEHASDGAGINSDDRGGLNAVWNRLF